MKADTATDDKHAKAAVKNWSQTYGALLHDLHELNAKKVGEWMYATNEGQVVKALIDLGVLRISWEGQEGSPEKYFSELPDRTLIVIRYYGLMGFKKETLTAIAAAKGISRHAASQCRWKGLRDLKHQRCLRLSRLIEKDRDKLT